MAELAKRAADRAKEQQETVLAEATRQDLAALDKLPLLRMLTPADEAAARG